VLVDATNDQTILEPILIKHKKNCWHVEGHGKKLEIKHFNKVYD
jgi:hypothetical protein